MASCLWLAFSSSSALMCETALTLRSKHVQPAELMTGSRARRRQAVTWQAARNGRNRSYTFADLREYTPSTSEAELAEYKSLTVPATAVDPVAFWKQKAKQFPIMSLTQGGCKLCASTSSTQSERDLQFLWCL